MSFAYCYRHCYIRLRSTLMMDMMCATLSAISTVCLEINITARTILSKKYRYYKGTHSIYIYGALHSLLYYTYMHTYRCHLGVSFTEENLTEENPDNFCTDAWVTNRVVPEYKLAEIIKVQALKRQLNPVGTQHGHSLLFTTVHLAEWYCTVLSYPFSYSVLTFWKQLAYFFCSFFAG